MSHRYPTRFQLKKAHAAPLQVPRLQAQPHQTTQTVPIQAPPRQSVASQTDVVRDELRRRQEASSAVVNYFLSRAAASTSFLDKVLETIKLFEHLYEHSVLLTTHPRFKDITWHKMAQLESEMTDVLMRIPSTLDIDHVLNTRTTIARLHNLMNMIRQKYY
jgi:hypothetical protein